ncbi:tRNA (cytidine/uridine-2'-O-)-methyltransferase [Rubritalea squalenifaciens DSM 18772]|uniref:Putative tRNA (cytidine(34)-2'-O)-methyltransferase n=1 Tax=Rubritalea squalenifaciens DSM 18772 TaxID=1123071 RepID=A0A1M6D9T7_9BACT|nr:tRNA (cytidine(34)-2'-O)-methyltransferase [Rubritalea squalenifaciens]SHI69929.1 tRNA (cytidine/uridine-2'-O-)-methyltransferase [Rubritalea squalenifaciens DSM 18772]
MFNIVMVHPEIPHNTGAAGRLALATGATLHLVKPLGFSIDEKAVRRSGLDYWKDVDLKVWESWEEFEQALPEDARMFLLTTKATKAHWDMEYSKGDYLLFGRETKGLGDELISKYPENALRIPMVEGGTRSLNLATAVAIVLYEACRQVNEF